MTALATPLVSRPDRKQMRKLMGAGLLGSSIEWYDFFIYGTAAALVFGTVFFPDSAPLVGTLLSFSTFWAGFVARPIGGLVFGYIGDRVGRKPAVLTCLIMVTVCTFLIGCLPTASTIGIAAPILLVVLRFVQGIAVGGQWGGVVLLLTESADPSRRGRTGAFGQMGVPGGLLLGTLAFLIVTRTMSEEAFVSWGWRIPFLASALLLPIVLFIHFRVEETPAFRALTAAATKKRVDAEPASLKEVLIRHWRPILLGAGVVASSNAYFFVGNAGILDYGTRDLGLERNSLLTIALATSIVSMFAIYLAGAASDRHGRKPLLVAGTILLAVWAFPYFWLVDTASLALIAVALLVASLGSSLLYGAYATYLGELFPPHIRYSGMSIAYQIAAIVVSGGTPLLMTALLAEFGSTAPVSVFLLIVGVIAASCALAGPETRRVHRSDPPARAAAPLHGSDTVQ